MSIERVDQKRIVLRVQKGSELSLRRLDEISSKESLMRPAYEQATRALVHILRMTRDFHEEFKTLGHNEYELNNLLFRYSGNLIAFAAQRGGGKTASMLSFANILKNRFADSCGECKTQQLCSQFQQANRSTNVDNSFLELTDAQWLERCRFIPMTPIAPTILESKQNILYVVFTRLYRYAEKLLEDSKHGNRFMESKKNDLIRSFHRVLSGINGIKRPNDGQLQDLSSIQDISDGLSLSKHFYTLVQNILEFAAPDNGVSDRYLVIQLDDADTNAEKVYEVMEDVRRYLMIPNLVILMATDLECMHDVILQDNLKKFPDLAKYEQDHITAQLSRTTTKYIDKLIPPTNMVHLPRYDRIVAVNSNRLELQYVDKSGKNILEWTQQGSWNMQTTLLMLIYRKTGVLFVSPENYMHNIIPKTLRGLNQLLNLLEEMEDIPLAKPLQCGDVGQFANAVLNQLQVEEENLERFADYFEAQWMIAKISNLKDRHFLMNLSRSVSANRVRLAVQYLRGKYEYRVISEYSRNQLDEMMWELEKTNRTQDDFLLMFTIRTLFTLEGHRQILAQKRADTLKFLSGKPEHRVLIFDLDPEEIHVPKLLSDEEWNTSETHLLEFYTILLRLASFPDLYSRIENIQGELMQIQNQSYLLQESAVAICINSDIHGWRKKRRKERPKDTAASTDADPNDLQRISEHYKSLVELLASINGCTMQTYRPEFSAIFLNLEKTGIAWMIADKMANNVQVESLDPVSGESSTGKKSADNEQEDSNESGMASQTNPLECPKEDDGIAMTD